MKRITALLVSLLLGTYLYAQNEVDALRYTRLNPSGTARFMSMGGAFGALGADFSTLSYNPAGIGLYKSSEITITPSIYIGRTETEYFGTVNSDEKYNFNLGNFGIVMVSDPSVRRPETKWRNVQFGFGLNRLANFNSRVVINGFNETSSYLSPYVDDSRGVSLNDLSNFGAGLAYDAELMFETEPGVYGIDMYGGGVSQKKTIDAKGSINEMVLSLGANYDDKVYIGGTLGIPYIKYKESSIYTETDSQNRNDYFRSFTRLDELETSGTGINLKLGVIVRPADWFRISGAIETPTFYTEMTDTYSTTFRSYFDTASSKRAGAEGFYEYELNTPFKAMAGVGFIIGTSGLISADYQYLNYSRAKLRASDYDFEVENAAISEYNTAHNIKLGAEWRYGLFSFRGGYGISANPYKTGTNSIMNSYSAGIGIRDKKFFIDLGWVMSDMDDEYYLYNAPAAADPAYANTKINNSMFLLTLGIKY